MLALFIYIYNTYSEWASNHHFILNYISNKWLTIIILWSYFLSMFNGSTGEWPFCLYLHVVRSLINFICLLYLWLYIIGVLRISVVWNKNVVKSMSEYLYVIWFFQNDPVSFYKLHNYYFTDNIQERVVYNAGLNSNKKNKNMWSHLGTESR